MVKTVFVIKSIIIFEFIHQNFSFKGEEEKEKEEKERELDRRFGSR